MSSRRRRPRRLDDSGRRFAGTPARGARGLALKLRHIAADVTLGPSRWAGDLVLGAPADAECMVEKQ